MFHSLRISTKLLLTIFPLLFLGVGISVYLNNRYQEEQMLDQARIAAQTHADIIRESLVNMMVTRERVDDDYLHRLRLLRDIRELHVHFIAESLHLRPVYQDEERMERLKRREQLMPALKPDELQTLRTGQPLWHHRGTTFNAVIPFVAEAKCRQCHAVSEGFVLGAAEMDISLDRISASIRSNWVRSIWIMYIATSIALILSIIVYRILVERRMRMLVEATKIIGSGNLEHSLPNIVSAGDELGDLTRAFDAMRSALKKAYEQNIHSERLATIGQMASSIIHDFRSPMSTINLAIQSLQRGTDFSPEKTQLWHVMIRDSVQRMVIMAQELMDFSRGETRIEKSECAVQEFTDTLVESVKPTLEQSKITLLVDQKYAGTVRVDTERLHRALINIINNAQDAMTTGGTLRLAIERMNGSVQFTISDTGVGIPPEIRDKMFDAFVTAGKRKGTGLGLAITKRIIDQHGGTIAVESEIGKGTTFRVAIPLN